MFDQAALDSFMKNLVPQGLGLVLLAAFVMGLMAFFGWVFLLLRRYAPRVAEAHINFVTTCQKTQIQIADSLSQLSETHSTSEANHQKTHAKLDNLAEGLARKWGQP